MKTLIDQIEAQKIVTEYLDAKTKPLLELLETVRGAAQRTKKACGEDVVYRVYSRAEKQKDELKTKSKIVKKFIENRAEDASYELTAMSDIVGITIVVYYDDQIPVVIEQLHKEFSSPRLEFEEYVGPDGISSRYRVHREKGYHATHLRVRSNIPALLDLTVEVQVKTMLHDAWGAKMHDLVYKPAGQLDPKLRQLMESFGDSLQAIEVQSETLRDAIVGRIKVVKQQRRAALINLMNRLESQSFGDPASDAAYRECLSHVNGNRSALAAERSEDQLMIDTLAKVTALNKFNVDAFTRLKLLVFIATLRDDTDLGPTIDQALKAWRAAVKPPMHRDVFVTSAALHQTNRIAEAITLIRNSETAVSGTDVADHLKLNLANYIIENNLSTLTQKDRDEVEAILSEISPRLAGPPLEGALLSTRAAVKIVFGDEKELEEGIALCSDASTKVDPSGKGYCDLYLTHGWQRKLRL